MLVDNGVFEPGVPVSPAGPFPNLRCREIVKGIAEAAAETITHCNLTEDQAYHFTLGIIRGARLVLALDDDVAESYVLSLLDTFNQRGVRAVRELVETVTGQELELPAAH
jgi:hypothetical protein